MQSNANSTRDLSPLTRRDGLAVVLIVACLVGMFWKVVFTSAMFFYRDVYNYTFPNARLIHDLCRQGFLPYWNPYLNYGQPLLANPNLLFFYPFTLLIVLLPIDAAFTLHFVGHFAWAGIGVYVLARTWGQSYRGAFFAAMVFMLSGPVLSLGDLYNEVACAAWIPWALLVTDRGLKNGRLRPWILLAVIFSFQWTAGEPMTMLATFGLCFAFACYWKARNPASEAETGNSKLENRKSGTSRTSFHFRFPIFESANSPRGRAFMWATLVFVLVGVGMLLLCAAQFLPASDLLSQSRRGIQGLRFRETSNWAVNPYSLPETIVPDFFGSGIGAPTGWLWLMSDSNLPYFLSIFVGFVPVFCALAGWALGRDRRRSFIAGSAAAFLLLSFGHFTPVFALTYLLFPPLAVVRYPVKLLVLVMFLLAVLAGWGFDALLSPDTPWKTQGRRLLTPLKVFLACVAAILAVAWLAPGWIASPTRWALRRLGESPFNLQQMPDFLVTALRYQLPGLAGFGLGALVLALGLAEGKAWSRPGLHAFALLAIGQLAAVNSGANPTVPKTFFTYRPPVLKEFKDPPGTYRVASFWPIVQTPDTTNLQTYINFESIPEAAGLEPVGQAAFQARLQLATGSMLNQVEGNVNIDLERSLPPHLYDLEIFQNQHATDALHVDCLLGRTNVKYVIRPSPADSAATRPMGKLFNGSPIPSSLYEDLCFMPRAYVAGSRLFSTNSEETINHMADPGFDAHNTVILASPSASLPSPGPGPIPPPSDGSSRAGEVEITEQGPNALTLRAKLTRPGYIVLLDRYDPNWQATMDGHPATVYRANQIFRAIHAEPGVHQIHYEYRQHGFSLGVTISILTAASLAILYFRGTEI